MDYLRVTVAIQVCEDAGQGRKQAASTKRRFQPISGHGKSSGR